jgi:heptosyltransferase-2
MPGTEKLNTRILVIRFSSLGDVVLVEPAFRALKRRLPRSSITFLTRSIHADIHRSNPAVDEIWAFDPATRSLSSLLRKVRETRFDMIVDLHGSLRSRLITLAGGADISRYRMQRLRRFLLVLRPPFKRQLPLTHVIDRYLDAAGSRASNRAEGTPEIHLTDELLRAGREMRRELMAGRDGRMIALLPGARHAPKEWPRYHFGELAGLLKGGGDIPIVVVPPDQPEIGIDLNDGEDQFDLIGPMSEIMRLAALLSAADGVVANDSGPMHLAAALGIPTVGLFGPTSPGLGFSPRGEAAAHIHLGLDCSPCSKHGQRVCWRRERHCLLELGPRQVLDELDRLISLRDQPGI